MCVCVCVQNGLCGANSKLKFALQNGRPWPSVEIDGRHNSDAPALKYANSPHHLTQIYHSLNIYFACYGGKQNVLEGAQTGTALKVATAHRSTSPGTAVGAKILI